MSIFLKRIGALIFTLTLFIFVLPSIANASAPTCSSETPCWIAKPNMPEGRSGFGIATGGNGHVYVVGGSDNNGNYLDSLREYNPTTGVWVAKTPAPGTRIWPGFTYDPANNKFYLAGGWENISGTHNELYEYDPVTDSWTQKASMNTAISEFGLASANGKIYAIGGLTSSDRIADVEEYDPTTDTWTTRRSMPTARDGVSAVTAPNGKIYAIGGMEPDGTITNKVEEYYPVTDTWTIKTSMNHIRADFAASVNASGNILVAGGGDIPGVYHYTNTIEEYNLNNDTWVDRTSMPDSARFQGMALGGDGNVYIMGGVISVNSATDYNHIYTTNQPLVLSCVGQDPCWTQENYRPTARAGVAVASDAQGHIYVVGGGDTDRNFLNTLEEYNPATGIWTTKSPAPAVRTMSGFTYDPANNKFYLAGGWEGTYGQHSEVYEYNPVTDSWTQKASMNTAISEFGLAAANGKIYAIGGLTPADRIAEVEEYNPSTDTWVMKAPMPTPRDGVSVVAVPSGKIYAMGGMEPNGVITNTVEEYNPITNTWMTKAPMNHIRTDFSASVNANGNIYVVGGGDTPGVYHYTNTVEEYNPSTDIWVERTPYPVGLWLFGMALGDDNNIHVIEGETNDDYTSYTTYAGISNSVRQITALTPAKVWVGLSNSNDKGIKFDLKAEAYKGTTLISSGELDGVDSGGSGFNNANLDTIPFNSFSPVDFPVGSQLSVKLYVRNSCTGSKNNGKIARLWYNNNQANSGFGVTIGSNTNNYYLINNSTLSTSVGIGPQLTTDVDTKTKCVPFSSFGIWTVTP